MRKYPYCHTSHLYPDTVHHYQILILVLVSGGINTGINTVACSGKTTVNGIVIYLFFLIKIERKHMFPMMYCSTVAVRDRTKF